MHQPASALFTDLYELTMAQAYLAEGMTAPATFSLAVRQLPPVRNLLLAVGLGTLLDDLAALRFAPAELDYLRGLGRFEPAFLEWLARFRFTGDVDAVPEGTPVFADEPILELTAPLPVAQLVETLVMNRLHLQTVAASKASRVVRAAAGRPVIDFGARRAHGLEAATLAARAFHVAGVAATSNVLAGARFGIPVTGTMAHAFVQAHDDEARAFRAFARAFPATILLVDTYDTPTGVERVVELARALGAAFRVEGVRLDSGDLGALARAARARLDAAGLGQVMVFASGGLDETRIAALVAEGAPIDGFGVGSRMAVSADAPDLDVAYKLCAYAGRGRTKLAAGKPILPGRKQVWRTASGDVIGRAGETLAGRPLLQPAMRAGRILAAADLAGARRRAVEEIAALPAAVRDLAPADPPWSVRQSAALQRYHAEVCAAVRGGMPPPTDDTP